MKWKVLKIQNFVAFALVFRVVLGFHHLVAMARIPENYSAMCLAHIPTCWLYLSVHCPWL